MLDRLTRQVAVATDVELDTVAVPFVRSDMVDSAVEQAAVELATAELVVVAIHANPVVLPYRAVALLALVLPGMELSAASFG